jgi:hypothetical protein
MIRRSLSRGGHSHRGSDDGYRDQRRERDRSSNRQGERRRAASLPPSFGPRWGGAGAFLPGLSLSGVGAGALVAHAPVVESALSSALDTGLASQQEGISARWLVSKVALTGGAPAPALLRLELLVAGLGLS